MTVDAYCINLDRRPDRWRRSLAALEPHNAWLFPTLRRVSAVDGACVDLQRLPSYLSNAQVVPFLGTGLAVHLDAVTLPPGAVGCMLSHVRLWRLIASRGGDLEQQLADAPGTVPGAGGSTPLRRHRGGRVGTGGAALVLEDDIVAAVPDLRERLDEVLGQLPADWDLCYVGFHAHPDWQLRGLGELGCGEYDASAPLPVEAAAGTICGTFAYLLSAKGARRLLEPGIILPLSGRLQLDSAISAAFPCLSAWHVPFARPLFYSPQSQAVAEQSDVQCRYYGPVEAQWASYAAAIHALQGALDEHAPESPCCGLLPALPIPDDDIAASLSDGTRRCVCIDFVDPGEGGRAQALRQLEATVASLRLCNGGSGTGGRLHSFVLVWYGEDPAHACHAAALCHECALVVRGAFKEEANMFTPGAGPWVHAYGPVFSGFVSLHALTAVELDQLLYVRAGTQLRVPLAQLFASHREHELYVEYSPEPLGARALLAAVLPRYQGVASHWGRSEIHGAEHFVAAAEGSGRLLLYNRRAWLKASRWCSEMFQMWMRLRSDLPCSISSERERERLVAGCALRLAGIESATFALPCCCDEPPEKQGVELAAARASTAVAEDQMLAEAGSSGSGKGEDAAAFPRSLAAPLLDTYDWVAVD